MTCAGKLKICILEARLTHDTEPMGKMDPYVIVETRMQRFRTKMQEDAGKTPAWADEVIEIDVKYIGDDIHFAVMDDDPGNDDLVGDCTVKLSGFIGEDNKGMDDWWQISYEGKAAGHIHMKSEWHPTDEPLKQAPPPE